MLKRVFTIFSFLIILVSTGISQEGANPFDLPEKEKESTEYIDTPRRQSDNPFDLLPIDAGPANRISSETVSPIQPRVSISQLGGRIGISLLLVVPLALLLTLFRGVFNDFLESAYRDRKFNQFFRRQNSMWIIPNILLYTFFFLSISIFIHLALTYFGYDMFENIAKSLLFLFISITGFFTVKHALIFFLGDTFDVKNESTRYSLLILTFNIIIGVFLTPINLLLLLGPDSVQGAVVIIGLVLCGITILLLLLRSLSVSNKLLIQHSFHFFMYLCTIEIAPLFIIAKLLT